MEKKLFGFFIPLCIIGFVCFWISTMFLQTVPVTTFSSYSTKDDGGDNWSCSKTLKNESIKAEVCANPNIELNISDVIAVVEPYDGVNILVEAKNTSNTAVKVVIERKGDDSTKISVGNDSIFDFGFGLIRFNLPNIFGAGNIIQKQVTIKVPEKIYGSVKINQGSGKSDISGIDAHENFIDIGSGEFSFKKDKNLVAKTVRINIGSGKASFSGMTTENYDINIGSGELNINNLTGKGDIDMGSGKADISFDKSPNGKLDMGSGYAKFSLPYSAATKFNCDIGSGCVELNTGGDIIKIGHGKEEYRFGSIYTEPDEFKINLGSGKVDVGYIGFTPGTISSQIYAMSSNS